MQLNKVEENLKKAIDSKINNFLKENVTYTAATCSSSVEGSDHITNKDTVTDLKQVIKEARKEQIIEEEDRRNRAPNLIVHGVKENTDDPLKLKGEDEQFTTSFLELISIKCKPIAITRLGKPNASKKRPIKLRMSSKKEKMEIMSRLKFLKNAEERFKRLSITDDYTIAERALIKEWKEKAILKNNEEVDQAFIWKIRGNPKNGLTLVRFTKQ